MMFNFFDNLLNISMIFKQVLFNDFDLMLLSSLTKYVPIFQMEKKSFNLIEI